MYIQNFAKNEVNVRFFSIFSHSAPPKKNPGYTPVPDNTPMDKMNPQLEIFLQQQ